jgi:hypothetical protein
MTYYLADFDIRDGDNEYKLQFLVQAENLADAESKAINGLCYNYGVDRTNGMIKRKSLICSAGLSVEATCRKRSRTMSQQY